MSYVTEDWLLKIGKKKKNSLLFIYYEIMSKAKIPRRKNIYLVIVVERFNYNSKYIIIVKNEFETIYI